MIRWVVVCFEKLVEVTIHYGGVFFIAEEVVNGF